MNSLVDRIYLINLDKDYERLNVFDQLMNKFGWEYQRFSAIRGKEHRNNFHTRSLADKYIGGFTYLSHAEVGCMLSHLSLWKLLQDSEWERILIFEDDANTNLDGSTIENYLRDFYSYLQENEIQEPDMLYLGKALDRCADYTRVWKNVFNSSHPLCLHAYIINRKGVEVLLNRAPFRRAIDVEPIRAIEAGELNVMAFHPSLFYQDVFTWNSNLRSDTMNLTAECLMAHQYTDEQTMNYIIGAMVILILIILILIVSIFQPKRQFP